MTMPEDAALLLVEDVSMGNIDINEGIMRFMKFKETTQDAPIVLLDAVWLNALDDVEERKTRLHKYLMNLVQEGLIDVSDIVLRLEPESIPSEIQAPDVLRRKRTQTKTKLVYTLPKYNLFSECAEGYAAVCDMLWSTSEFGLEAVHLPLLVSKIKKAVVVYNLCLNKVLLIAITMIGSSATSSGQEALLSLVSSAFPVSRVNSVLRFHLLAFGKSDDQFSTPGEPAAAKMDDSQNAASTSSTPPELIRAIAILASRGMIALPEIWSVMTPTTPTITSLVSELKSEYDRQIEGVSKTLAGALATSSDDDSAAQPDMKLNQAISTLSESLGSTQRFQLLANLITSTEWTSVLPFLLHLQNDIFVSIPLGVVEPIRTALITHLWALLDSNDMAAMDEPLTFLGVYLASDSVLISTILRHLIAVNNPELAHHLLSRYILPALSIGSPNPSLAHLVWEVCGSYDAVLRYSIFDQWEKTYEAVFPLGLVKQLVTVQTKTLLKRVVKGAQVGDTVSRTSHYQLAKLCACNPLVVLKHMLSTIQVHFNYNLIEPYVEATGKLGLLSQDAVSFLIATTLACGRPALNMKTASIEAWLAHLSEFAGKFYRKHPQAPLDGTMRLVASLLVSSGPSGRVLLEAIIEHMGDFTVVHQLNVEQLESIAGGPALSSISQSSSFAAVEGGRAAERARAALKQALLQQPGLVASLWKYLTRALHELTSSQQVAQDLIVGGGVKLLGILFDGTRTCLLQLTEFLAQSCTREEYASLLPSDVVAVFTPTVEIGTGFYLIRPGFRPEWTEAVAAMVGTTERNPDSCLSASLFATFWRMSLSDIRVPHDSYVKQAGLLKDRIQASEAQVEKLEKVSRSGTADGKDQLRAAKRDLVRLREFAQKLDAEYEKQKSNFAETMTSIRAEMSSWWKDGVGNKASTLEFLEQLVAKRVGLSVSDALYCVYFVKLLVEEKVVGFQFLDFFNHWTELLSQTVLGSSEGEIKNLAEFVKAMMQFVVELRRDEKLFASVVSGSNPVFNRNYFSPEKGEIVPITAAELRRGHLKWESNIVKSLKQAMASADWCEKRNCLVLISKTCEVFPLIEVNARDLIKSVQDLAADSQEDIATLAQALSRKLASLEPMWLDKGVAPPQAVLAPQVAPAVTDTKPELQAEQPGRGERAGRGSARSTETKSKEVPAVEPKNAMPVISRRGGGSSEQRSNERRGDDSSRDVKRRPDIEEPIAKRNRQGDDRADREPVRERSTRSRARAQEPPPAPRPRDRGGVISRR